MTFQAAMEAAIGGAVVRATIDGEVTAVMVAGEIFHICYPKGRYGERPVWRDMVEITIEKVKAIWEIVPATEAAKLFKEVPCEHVWCD